MPSAPSEVSLNLHLRTVGAPDHLRHLIVDIARAGKHIVRKLWHGNTGKAGTENQFGEKQLAMDVVSNAIMEQLLRENDLVCCYASEESRELVELHDGAPYSVAFDPLDGSSLVDTNFAVGTIVGIFPGKEFIGRTPREQVAALYLIYGPRTMLVYTLGGGKGVHQFVLDDIGEFILDREFLGVGDAAKVVAPGNWGAAKEDAKIRSEILRWIDEGKKLRYSGCMVADCHHILAKGNGLFMNLGGASHPQGKLRLLYECGPFAFLMEEAGGASSDGAQSLLDAKITALDQRTPIIIGSKEEVERIVKS